MNKSSRTKIKILHIVLGLGVGGAEIVLLQYVKALGTEKYRHFVYCFGENGPVKEKLERLNVNVCMGKKRRLIKNPYKFAVSILMLIADINKYIKKNKIDIIQSHLSHSNQLAIVVSKLSHVPAFPTIHNTMEFIDRRDIKDPRVILNKIVNIITFFFAEKIIAVSSEIKIIVEKKFRLRDDRIVVVKNGIVLDKKALNHGFRVEDGFPMNNSIKILTVGRLTYQKAMEVLVKATNDLVRKGITEIDVVIVGEGNQRPILEKMIREYKIDKYIKLVGLRNDVVELMKDSDIFVLPSRFEGLSIAMIEAMACGLPIIASDAPGISTYIENGVNGLLFPIENHIALSEHIMNLAEDRNLRERLSLGATAAFNEEFDMKKNIVSFEKLINTYVSTK